MRCLQFDSFQFLQLWFSDKISFLATIIIIINTKIVLANYAKRLRYKHFINIYLSRTNRLLFPLLLPESLCFVVYVLHFYLYKLRISEFLRATPLDILTGAKQLIRTVTYMSKTNHQRFGRMNCI